MIDSISIQEKKKADSFLKIQLKTLSKSELSLIGIVPSKIDSLVNVGHIDFDQIVNAIQNIQHYLDLCLFEDDELRKKQQIQKLKSYMLLILEDAVRQRLLKQQNINILLLEILSEYFELDINHTEKEEVGGPNFQLR